MRADPIVVQRWRELREMLVAQLEMFESGRLTLKTADVDVSDHAVSKLRRNILEFDELILEDEAAATAKDARSNPGVHEPAARSR